ncbi:hypothetical protein [Nocardia sp. CC201C]|uniref:hypothetical protein n=1 Tax=Nocardia sp. CC201C TaxID=3044575 RepID=UPI0024A98793|nr:hypothetical protein [Nocardia sp. CC201C]
MGIFRRRDRRADRRGQVADNGADFIGEAAPALIEAAAPGLFRVITSGIGRLFSAVLHALN